MTLAPGPAHGSLRIILAIPFFCSGMGFVLWSVVRGMDRVERVNALLPREERFDTFFWGPEKSLRFRRTHKALFPGDRGLWKDWGLMLIGVLLEGAAMFLLFS